mmetsp:Transcript_8670/g.12013  ORF Transcript_8670/g.12013 Transcript_8670/m.12013 type:complete len:256 (-) Transcript_8670:102-869(-)
MRRVPLRKARIRQDLLLGRRLIALHLRANQPNLKRQAVLISLDRRLLLRLLLRLKRHNRRVPTTPHRIKHHLRTTMLPPHSVQPILIRQRRRNSFHHLLQIRHSLERRRTRPSTSAGPSDAHGAGHGGGGAEGGAECAEGLGGAGGGVFGGGGGGDGGGVFFRGAEAGVVVVVYVHFFAVYGGDGDGGRAIAGVVLRGWWGWCGHFVDLFFLQVEAVRCGSLVTMYLRGGLVDRELWCWHGAYSWPKRMSDKQDR